MGDVFLKKRAVLAATGLTHTMMYAMIARGEFPKPVRLGSQATAWPSTEIEQWQAARLAEREEKWKSRPRVKRRKPLTPGPFGDTAQWSQTSKQRSR